MGSPRYGGTQFHARDELDFEGPSNIILEVMYFEKVTSQLCLGHKEAPLLIFEIFLRIYCIDTALTPFKLIIGKNILNY